jgi:hypothetical protein
MKYIHATLEKQFIFALKSNRLIALNKEDKANGRYVVTLVLGRSPF